MVNQSEGEILYTIRVRGNRFQPPVYALGDYTLRVGRDRPNLKRFNLTAMPKSAAGVLRVSPL